MLEKKKFCFAKTQELIKPHCGELDLESLLQFCEVFAKVISSFPLTKNERERYEGAARALANHEESRKEILGECLKFASRFNAFKEFVVIQMDEFEKNQKPIKRLFYQTFKDKKMIFLALAGLAFSGIGGMSSMIPEGAGVVGATLSLFFGILSISVYASHDSNLEYAYSLGAEQMPELGDFAQNPTRYERLAEKLTVRFPKTEFVHVLPQKQLPKPSFIQQINVPQFKKFGRKPDF